MVGYRQASKKLRFEALKKVAFLRTWCKDKRKGVATTVPPKHLKGSEKYLWKWRLPINELDQLLLVRNVGLDANGCLCKASWILASALKFPHHVGAEERNLSLDLEECIIFSLSLSFVGVLSNCKVKTFPKIFHITSELFELCLVILK